MQNYKKFVEKRTISFCNQEGQANDMTLIIGNNGTGKSTLLQAIVALIAPLTRNNFLASDLDWNGFEFRFIQNGRVPIEIQATIEFDKLEIESTVRYFNELKEKINGLNVQPTSNKIVNLKFDYQNNRSLALKPSNNYQFFGHQYAKQLTKLTPKDTLFENVGNVYYYTEQRNSQSISNIFGEEKAHINSIRSFLASAYNYHLAVTGGRREIQPGQFDFYDRLSRMYSQVFPERSFVGSSPRFDIFEKSEAPDFFLCDGKNNYELSEMSAGERAIFPILMDFARYNINNSIIIIDEVELHLHAPLQQTFIKALPKLGKNNQFLLTAHSDYVMSLFDESENQIIRLR